VIYENAFLTSTVADAYAGDNVNYAVYAINSGGVVGSGVAFC
jgi:cell division protein FtsW (lipid II flippase)